MAPVVPKETCLASLEALPHHLLENIFTFKDGDVNLELSDLAALRLTSATIHDTATSILFSRIRISQLRHDRDAFLNICRSPHLAQHVREIEWQEISWYPGFFQGLALKAQETSGDDLADFSDSLDSLAGDLFWLPKLSEALAPGQADPRGEVIAKFRAEFDSALACLPKLHTLVSQPMPHDRELDCDDCESEYPLSADLFHSQLQPTDPPQSNDGLFLFLLPAIQSSGLSGIKLLWQEESSLGASYRRQALPGAFEQLHALSLSLAFRDQTPPGQDELIANLNAANQVSDLCLRIHGGKVLPESYSNFKAFQLALLRFSLEEMRTDWSGLRSLSLVSMPVLYKVLPKLVAHNAESLQHIYIADCGVSFGMVKDIGSIPKLKLKSFRIVENEDVSADTVKEDDLLRFVNQETIEIDSKTPFLNPRYRKGLIRTVVAAHKPNVSNDEDEHSACSDADSEDSLDHRIRAAPRWVWGRYFNQDTYYPNIYCHQVPASDPSGEPTRCWKFTYRSGGLVAYGKDPLDWFEDWDVEEGDTEEPLPYCDELWRYVKDTEHSEYDLGSIQGWLGANETAWELLTSVKPPDGAVLFDEDLASALSDVY
ncbi:hypothetical protein B0I35DRAFT_439732 [Stachybotrys elegans]|uniref:F-box domain-containing protein n=1 Tax=Stachybotrys elegans TaxID=80388 RepID=A0A8K0WNR7_9HYPO|nr:hypothetical protein B0I35DRAFT_439732 [Stachybotrys elegans]